MTGRSSDRDPYPAVGEATRLAIDRAMPGLTLPEARIMLALVHKLTSWSKLGEPIAARQLAEATGMDDRAVRKAVASLAHPDRGAIVRRATEGRHASTYSLPDLKGANPGDINPGSEDRGSSQPGSDTTPNPGSPDPLNPGSPDHLPENYPRTTSEDARRTSPGAVRPLDGMEPSPPASGADPKALAQAILNDWWERQDPRPQQPYPAALEGLTKALRSGWKPDELRQFLDDEGAPVSGGRLDVWRRRRSGTNGDGRRPPSTAAAVAHAERVMGLR